MVFDTMVFTWALLGVEPFRDDAILALRRAGHRRTRLLSCGICECTLAVGEEPQCRTRPGDKPALRCGALVTEVVPASLLTQQALELSVTQDVAVYDTLFVTLAIQRNCMLVTGDDGLLRSFQTSQFRRLTTFAQLHNPTPRYIPARFFHRCLSIQYQTTRGGPGSGRLDAVAGFVGVLGDLHPPLSYERSKQFVERLHDRRVSVNLKRALRPNQSNPLLFDVPRHHSREGAAKI